MVEIEEKIAFDSSQVKMYLPVLVISVLLVAVSAKSFQDASFEEMETERIILGRTASAGQFPWAAALFYNGQFICTCSIISPTTVLTAAHCIKLNGQYQPAELYYAIANVSKSAPSVRIDFASVTPHPDYNDQVIDNDVAVFKTTEPIPLGNDVKPICIARPNTPMNEYQTAIAMGWGNTIPLSFLPPRIPDMLQYTEQKIVDNSLCGVVNSGINEAKICATGTVLLNGICNGDSGGPLVAMNNGTPVEIGIASYINGIVRCGKAVPGVWTRTSYHYDFIMQTANDPSICTA